MGLEPKKLRSLGREELETEERALREEIWKLRLQQAMGQLQNGHKVRDKRHDLARVLTIQAELKAKARTKDSKK
jgi:large subunit ribosomal protein L29